MNLAFVCFFEKHYFMVYMQAHFAWELQYHNSYDQHMQINSAIS